MIKRKAAPGLSGLPGRVWAQANKLLGDRLRHLFTECMRQEIFLSIWRRTKLVLVRKEGKPADTPLGYRPICLLYEEGKLFERIIVDRLVRHLEEDGPDLHTRQYGFWRGRNIVNAIHVRSFSRAKVQEGRVLAVSLDISNAFNTLPWDRIGRMLHRPFLPQKGSLGLSSRPAARI